MSWLRSLFGDTHQPSRTGHVGVLVRGTLLNAEMAVAQLGMEGAAGGMTGIASVFGMLGGLEAQIGEGRWVSLSALQGRWILVIPDDAYAQFRPQFDATVGGSPLDGRVKPKGTAGRVQIVNVSREAVDQLRAIIDAMPPLAPQPKPAARVTVGHCAACGRDLRVKAQAVRPVLHLTCKCGAKNSITPEVGGDAPPTGPAADPAARRPPR